MSEPLTLLLTDVVDSTQLNDRLGDTVMGPLWAEHDRQSRVLMARWRAREVGRSDGFLLLFAQVSDAIGFAHDYHRALAQLVTPLRARVGIHTAAVALRQNSALDVARGAPLLEVDGLALPLAARLMAAAAGQQTLISSESRLALQLQMQGEQLVVQTRQPAPGEADLPKASSDQQSIRLRLHDQGYWRLKGIDTPVQVYQSGDADDNFAPPPDSAKAYRVVPSGSDWLPARELPHRLPVERDLFVGRSEALRALAQHFDAGQRLVSLLGIGGIGKTRLSWRYARQWLGEYPGGAWFCDLSAAQGTDGIVYAVAQALELALGKTDPIQLIATAIAERGRCLVILDNFEQVARYAEATLGVWLQQAPDARFIVTSRELLGIAGEQALLLAPLDLPEAELLLRERMAAAGLHLPLAAVEADAVAPLVELLDRLPLAIELAAARARVMPPSELLARMGERFKLLATHHGRHDRQATLRATLNWSWDLLSPAEQLALAQCAVFEGGFTLKTAEAVIDLSTTHNAPWVADVVQALVEKSLLRRSDSHRFDMLRSVHDYAAQRLAASPMQSAAMHRHWQHFAALDEQAAIANRCIEAENLVAAGRRALEAADLEAAADALVAAWAALNLTGPFSVAIERADALYRAAWPQAMSAALTARWVSGSARYLAGDVAAAQQDLELAAQPGSNLIQQSRALVALGQLERSVGHLQRADELLSRALACASAAADSGLMCRAYNALGILRLSQGRLDDALQSFTTGLGAARLTNDLKQQASLLGNIGVVERRRGNDAAALQHYQEALLLAQQIGDRRFEGNMRSNLGLYFHQVGESDQALSQLQAALQIAQKAGLTRLAANASCNLGLVEESLGHEQPALDAFNEALRLAQQLRDDLLDGHFRVYLGRFMARVGRETDARDCLNQAQLLLVSGVDSAVLGLLACAQAECAALFGDTVAAVNGRDRAYAELEKSNGAVNSELALEYRRVSAWLSSR